VHENIAIRQYRNEQEIKYINTLFMVQSVMYAAGVIAAASTGSAMPSPDKLNELNDAFKELLMPEYAEERQDKAERVKKILEDGANQAPFVVTAMAYDKRKKKGLN